MSLAATAAALRSSQFFYTSHLDPLVNREAVNFLGRIDGGLFSGFKRFDMLSLFGIPDL